eukprot:scaffold1403_cov241-Pinguiococcus_pyrenoidosus.AAC.9
MAPSPPRGLGWPRGAPRTPPALRGPFQALPRQPSWHRSHPPRPRSPPAPPPPPTPGSAAPHPPYLPSAAEPHRRPSAQPPRKKLGRERALAVCQSRDTPPPPCAAPSLKATPKRQKAAARRSPPATSSPSRPLASPALRQCESAAD